MGTTWKSRVETFHGSNWGYVVVALVIIIVLSLLGSIFYLIGEGMKSVDINAETVFSYSVLTLFIIFLIVVFVFFLAKVGIIAISSITKVFGFIFGIFTGIWSLMWTLFKNIYLMAFVIILIVVLITGLSLAVYSEMEINLSNPLIIGLLVVLLILFFPFAIFLIDLFSYEHE